MIHILFLHFLRHYVYNLCNRDFFMASSKFDEGFPVPTKLTQTSFDKKLRDARKAVVASTFTPMTDVPPGQEQPVTYNVNKYWEGLAAAEIKKKDETAVAAGTPPVSPFRAPAQRALDRMKKD